MQVNFTFSLSTSVVKTTTLFFAGIILAAFTARAQNFCPNEFQYFLETFGSGTVTTSSPDVTSYIYQESGSLNTDGNYRNSNSTDHKPEWFSSADHTGDPNGKMLVANGKSGAFYNHIVGNPNGFFDGNYSISMFAMNLNKATNCGGSSLLPKFTFQLEYLAENLTWVPLSSTPVVSASIPVSDEPTWVQVGAVFTLPALSNFSSSYLRITIGSDVPAGCGNDFAIDDIKLATCPAGGPLPIEFLTVAANQQGSGIAVNWSTSFELNNRFFNVERSIDNGNNWQAIGTVRTTGNVNTARNYSYLDAAPIAGVNYYRIKQVDADGRFKYSPIVNVRMVTDQTQIITLNNPFSNQINVAITAKTTFAANVLLFDAAGKKVAVTQWNLVQGSNRPTLNNLQSLSSGIYILVIFDNTGAVLYKQRLLKQ